MPLPNFLIIGAMKSGTSSLHIYLRQHPAIYMPLFKEPSYFIDNGNITTWSSYVKLFDLVNNETAIGEASIAYLYAREAPERIKSALPKVKLVTILRNPYEMINSMYWYMVHGEAETLPLREALEQESNRMHDPLFKKQCVSWPGNYHYSSRAMYASQVERYYRLFGRHSLHIELYDDLKTNAETVCKRIFGFLDVDDSFVPDTTMKINAAGQRRSLLLHRTLYKENPLKSLARFLFPHHVRTAVLRRLSELNIKPATNPPLTDDVREMLKPKFNPDIDRLSELLQRDLSGWKI